MAADETPPSESPAEPAAAPEAPAAASPPAHAVVDLAALSQSMAAAVSQGVSEGLRTLMAQSGQRPAAAAPIEDVTDAEIDAAVARGEPVAPLVSKRASALVERAVRPLQERIAQLQEVGQNALAGIAERLAISAGGAADAKYVERWRGEITAELAKLPAEHRANPAVIERAVGLVLGMHRADIIAEEREAARRAGREEPIEGRPGAREPAGAAAESLETRATRVLGEGAVETLRGSKSGFDSAIGKLAQASGFKNADEYLEYAAKMGAEGNA